MKHSAAFEKIFGNVGNGLKTVGKDADGKPVIMRVGKTARDKAKGHVAGKKNRRMFDSKAGKFVKL